MDSLLQVFWEQGSELFLTLLPIANPLGLAAVFIELTKGFTTEQRHTLAIKVGKSCFYFLSGILLMGYLILSFFRISLPYITIAGGLLLLASSWDMLRTRSRVTSEEREEISNDPDEISFIPLTTPVIAGPGTIAATLAAASQIQSDFPGVDSLVGYSGALVGILVLGICVGVCFYYAENTFSRLGKTGTNLVSKISALILVAISIEMIWRGLSSIILASFGSAHVAL